MNIQPVYIHCLPDHEYDIRFDTILMPNAGVAVLCEITNQIRAQHSRILPPLAIDEQYPARNVHGYERKYLLEYLTHSIETWLTHDIEPVIFCTMLSYNAESTLSLLRTLKTRFGNRIRTGIGGQLVRVCPQTYLQNPALDHVSVGDAEATLAPLLLNTKKQATGYAAGAYAQPNYDTYLGLEERLKEMSQYQLGPFSNIRQLLTESVRGCAWAYLFKICFMCSLESVNTQPIFKAFDEHFQIEQNLLEKYGCNWIFDVSNQWLPTMGTTNAVAWLTSYLAARRNFGNYKVNRYTYLTTNSITPHTAPLLAEAGIKVAYVGLDGWDTTTRTALHKTQSNPHDMLEAARAAGIYIRTSLVIGSGLTSDSLKLLPDFVSDIAQNYGTTILSFGNFLEIILPGSPVWSHFHHHAQKNQINEVTRLYDDFYENGYLTWPQQERLTELYIRHTQSVTYEDVLEARNQAVSIINNSSIIGITIRDGGKLMHSP